LNRRDNIKLEELEIKSKRTINEVNKFVEQSQKFNEDLSKASEKNEEKISIINDDDIKKSSIFEFEISKL
jgi:hypothetical protein